MLFNNEADDDEKAKQVEQLMLLVKTIVKKNGGSCFRHMMSRELDQTKENMMKEEIRKRFQSGMALIHEGTPSKETESKKAKRASCFTRDDDTKEKEEADEEGATHVDQQAILRKQEVEEVNKQGRVKSLLMQLEPPSPERAPDNPPRHMWYGTQPTKDSEKIFSDVASLGIFKQGAPEVAAPDDQKQTAPEEPPKGLEWERGSDNDQYGDTLLKEPTTVGNWPFLYEVPDRPGMTLAEKKRLVEDALMKTVVNHPEELNDAQKEELNKAVKSVGTKFKEGMSKFALKTLHQCHLM